MKRTDKLIELRPRISTIKLDNGITDTEKFQNQILRPILKFQHDILLAFFHSCLTRSKLRFDKMLTEEQETKLDQLFQKELSLRNQSLGAVIAMLTIEEYSFYTKDASAHNRRIITMLKQRIMSTY